MRFVNSKELAVNKILATFNEFNNSRMIGDNSGWSNYALAIDDKYIFRFPKNEEALRRVYYEQAVLNKLKGILPDTISVPNYIYIDLENDYPFVGYEMIKGSFLSRRLYESMDNRKKEDITKLLSIFIDALHSIDYSDLDIIIHDTKDEFLPLFNEIKRVCYRYFQDIEIKATDELFNNYFNDNRMSSYKPSLIHGDLSLDHIIITDNGIGIIDFGDVRVFDPAYDLIWAYYMNEELYNILVQDIEYKYRIEEFYIKRTPYYSIIYSIKMDNDEQFQKSMQWMHELLIKE